MFKVVNIDFKYYDELNLYPNPPRLLSVVACVH